MVTVGCMVLSELEKKTQVKCSLGILLLDLVKSLSS